MARKNLAGLFAKAAEKWGGHQKKDYYQTRLSGLTGISFFFKKKSISKWEKQQSACLLFELENHWLMWGRREADAVDQGMELCSRPQGQSPLLEKAGRIESTPHPHPRSGTAKCRELKDPSATAPPSSQMSIGGTRGMPVSQRSPQREEALWHDPAGSCLWAQSRSKEGKTWQQHLVERPLPSRTDTIHSFETSRVAMEVGKWSDSKYTLNTSKYESITEIQGVLFPFFSKANTAKPRDDIPAWIPNQ